MNLFDRNRLNTGLNGEWLNDDEENGIHGTVLMAEDMNSLGTEINNLIKAGGMTPNKNENDQILRAVKNLGGSGVSSSASNVSYDNSISSLQQKNYDFPKFKSTIDDLTYISLTESSVMGKIEKEEDNYFLKGSVSAASSQNVLPIALTIEGKEDYEVLSFIAQFFYIDYKNINWTDALENEIIVNGINNGWQFVFVQNAIGIKRKDNGEIPENTYSVTLNIKNRVLLKPDENIIAWQYGINDNIVLKIVNENGNTKIKGITNIYAGVRSEETIFLTNSILENYIDFDIEHRSGIISSSSKNIIWTLKKSSSNYIISIKYTDSSQIQANDFFTIDITPDKNSNIDFTKGDAVNVQNAIDSLSELKQDKLTAGENIVIEKQGESTVIKSLGGGNAEDIGFDNTNAQLQQLVGYDFPKYKKTIANTINMVLITGEGDVPATITKQSDGSYRLNLSAQTYQSTVIQFIIKSIEGQSELFNISAILLQFFETEIFKSIEKINYFNLEADECVISEIDSPLKGGFALDMSSSCIGFVIARQDDTPIPTNNYNISLNIKNRVLRNQDSNLFCLTTNPNNKTLEYLVLENDNGITKIKGSISNLGTGTITGFYIFNNIIPNYFALDSDYISTSGITSSSGKSVKYSVITTNTSNGLVYLFVLQYTDGSEIQQGDVFTFNLTPDKNSTLDPIYQNVTNVQQAIEAVKTNIDTANSNIITINSKISSLNAAQISFNDINSQLGAANVQQAIEALANNIYDFRGNETLIHDEEVIDINGRKRKVYMKILLDKKYTFLADGALHRFVLDDIRFPVLNIWGWIGDKDGTSMVLNAPTSLYSNSSNNGYASITMAGSNPCIDYALSYTSYTRYTVFIKYYK